MTIRNTKSRISDVAYFLIAMFFSTLLALIFFEFIKNNPINIALVYIIALILVARSTNGYLYGILFAVFSVLSINFFFTYPYFTFSLKPAGYTLTFIGTLAITIITSARATHLKIQDQLLHDREELLRSSEKERMRANLLRAVSHDLRTPLTSIIGTSNTLLEHGSTYSQEECNEMIAGISDDANWLLNMVENLLSITRINGSDLKVKKSQEVLEEVVSEAVLRFKKRQPGGQVKVISPIDYILLPMDPLLIEQVIINLLENAYVHSTSDEPIEFLIFENESSVSFHIRDYGKGINLDKINTIFDGTSTNDEAKADSRKGMGIGLSICKTIIEAHDGTIYAQNRDQGAEFIFTLPVEANEGETR